MAGIFDEIFKDAIKVQSAFDPQKDPSAIDDSLTKELDQKNLTSDYSNLLTKASDKWDLGQDELTDLMNRVAYHESKSIPTQKQIEGKPGQEGMGLYQFESGKARGGETAGRRLINELGYVPDWLNITDEGLDASSLTPEQQNMLFLANYLQKPGESAGMYGLNEGNLSEWWVREHYAGPQDLRGKRKESFDESMKDYKDISY